MASNSSATGTEVVIRFHYNTGFKKVIKPDISVSDDDDLFVHYTEGHLSFQEGHQVKFSVSVKNDKKQAVNVNVTALDHGSNIEPRHRDSGRRFGFRGIGNGIMCYRCRGMGHIARQCSKRVRACFSCGEVGHLARDCTSDVERDVLGACKICGEMGHMARHCMNNVGGNRGFGNSIENLGDGGGEDVHLARDCYGSRVDCRPIARQYTHDGCRLCGEEGHLPRECLLNGGRSSFA